MRIVLASRIMARTTLDIDPVVLQELKVRGRREGKTIGQLVSEMLAVALESDAPPDPVPLAWATRSMNARVDLEDKEAVARALDET
jgi:hypothetical protein